MFHWVNIFSLTVSQQETIKLIKAVVFVNPFDEVDAVVSRLNLFGDQRLNSLINLYKKEPSRSGEIRQSITEAIFS